MNEQDVELRKFAQVLHSKICAADHKSSNCKCKFYKEKNNNTEDDVWNCPEHQRWINIAIEFQNNGTNLEDFNSILSKYGL